MSIAPVIVTVDVKIPPERAFHIFTGGMGRWWPSGKTIAKNPHTDVIAEPFPGGRWFERDAAGTETQWGCVLTWEPPSRLVLGWQLNTDWTYDPDFLTEVELSFAPKEGGGTRVTLEHRDLHRFGAEARARAEAVGRGWPAILSSFHEYANTLSEE